MRVIRQELLQAFLSSLNPGETDSHPLSPSIMYIHQPGRSPGDTTSFQHCLLMDVPGPLGIPTNSALNYLSVALFDESLEIPRMHERITVTCSAATDPMNTVKAVEDATFRGFVEVLKSSKVDLVINM